MPDLSMEYAALADALTDVRHTRDQLDQGRTRLHQSFSSFLGTGWTGQAADSFRDGWDDWSTGVGEVLEALGSIADLMQDYSAGLQQTDSTQQGSMGLLQSRLGGVPGYGGGAV